MDYLRLGQRIRRQRKLMGLTQKEVAERAGISLPFYGHIERGTRKASLETTVDIANALGVSTDMLLQDSLDVMTKPLASDASLQSTAARFNGHCWKLREHDVSRA